MRTYKKERTLRDKASNVRKKRMFVDLDGVLAVFRYGATPEELLTAGYFSSLAPQMNIVNGIKSIIIDRSEDVDVYILSSVLPEIYDAAKLEKQMWLKKHLPELGNQRQIFPFCGDNKISHIEDFNPATDILLDDYGVNCRNWKKSGARYIKVSKDSEDARKESAFHKYVISPDMAAPDIAAYLSGIIGA